MGLGIIISMLVIAAWAGWVAYQVSKAGGYPPYQDNTTKCNQDCRQGRNCDCYQLSCDMTAEEYAAQWPFPVNKP